MGGGCFPRVTGRRPRGHMSTGISLRHRHGDSGMTDVRSHFSRTRWNTKASHIVGSILTASARPPRAIGEHLTKQLICLPNKDRPNGRLIKRHFEHFLCSSNIPTVHVPHPQSHILAATTCSSTATWMAGGAEKRPWAFKRSGLLHTAFKSDTCLASRDQANCLKSTDWDTLSPSTMVHMTKEKLIWRNIHFLYNFLCELLTMKQNAWWIHW